MTTLEFAELLGAQIPPWQRNVIEQLERRSPVQDSDGRIGMYVDESEQIPKSALENVLKHEEARRLREEFKSRFPCPAEYDSKKIMKALEKLAGATEPVLLSDAALLPLTPGEKGYVLGILTALESGRTL